MHAFSSQAIVRRCQAFAHRHLSGLTKGSKQKDEVMLSKGHSDNVIRFNVMAHKEFAVTPEALGKRQRG